MDTYVRLGDLAGCVFPYDCRERAFVVLKAYLDDSGTHDNSDVIVMGGLVASEEAWAAFEPPWDALLAEYKIAPRDAHMNRCKHRKVSFAGWSDFKRHRALTRFRRIIEGTGGRLLAAAVSREVWESACAKSNLREYFADPIDLLQAHCLRKALESRRSRLLMGHERVNVTFDRRIQSLVTWNWMTLGFVKNSPSRFAGYAFGESSELLPLQAADMIAYEAFVFHCDRQRLGKEPAPRPNFARLMKNMANDAGFFTESQLLHYVAEIDRGIMARGGKPREKRG